MERWPERQKDFFMYAAKARVNEVLGADALVLLAWARYLASSEVFSWMQMSCRMSLSFYSSHLGQLARGSLHMGDDHLVQVALRLQAPSAWLEEACRTGYKRTSATRSMSLASHPWPFLLTRPSLPLSFSLSLSFLVPLCVFLFGPVLWLARVDMADEDKDVRLLAGSPV